jgi:hypothetical protein
MDIDALAALAANTVVATAVTDAFEALRAKVGPGGNVTNTMSGTVLNGPVLMGRDFRDITIGNPDDQPES